MRDDRSLVQQILDGDTEAFETLINSYRVLVIHVVYRMIMNTEDREDICQEVFIRIYRSLAGFRFESKLSTWISKIAYNTCINHLQKSRQMLIDECLPGAESLDDLPGGATPSDNLIEERDVSRRVKAEIDNLPTIYRTILTLYHLEEMSYAEIADIMDMPVGTVKSHLFRARKHLKNKLMSKYKREDLWS